MCESAFGVGEQFGWLIKKGEIFCRKYWREQLALRIGIHKAREPHFATYELGFVDGGVIWESKSCFVDCLLRELWGEAQSLNEKARGFYGSLYRVSLADKGH